uniref:SAM domain-containing protein n=1 Tax=Strigamia maritima TaxID=126957 RepID=T1J4G1_STRMM
MEDEKKNNCEKDKSCEDNCKKNEKEETNDDTDFIWDEYLEETDSVAAPPTSFIHVEKSLQSCFSEGMKLEVRNKEQDDAYWVASVVMTCGPLLRLRYEGYSEDRSSDFWCDIATNEVHAIGWCSENGKELIPPSAIKHKFSDWSQFLNTALAGSITIPIHLLEANGTNPIDLITQGMKIEVQEKLNPLNVWIATVLENVGGRLLLRYDGATASEDFWLFYLSYRLHPVGWASINKFKYKPPEALASRRLTDEWVDILQQALEEAKQSPLLQDIFRLQDCIREHNFKEGMKLEMVNPTNLIQICPATVTKVLNSEYFIVQIDDNSLSDKQPQVMSCHADSCLIFPKGWAKSNDLAVMHSKAGWMNSKHEFEWDEYLAFCKAEVVPDQVFNLLTVDHGFEKGMKLEAVNPFQPHQICAATVTKVVKHLLWIQLDSIDTFHPNHIVPYNSHEIFPVGWCESNHYPLKPPLHIQRGNGRVVMKVPIFIQEKPKKEKKRVNPDAKAWCPKIYFNHRCFTGPYLSNTRLAQLPRHVGPGPVVLVLKEVLSKLINVAYKSSKVLQELEFKGKHNPDMQQCVLKAKYKGKCHRKIVEILSNSEHVKEFCRDICLKLDCCPYLFGPKHVGDDCPHNCSLLTKARYASRTYSRRKRRLGRPPMAKKDENQPAKRGRKGKLLDNEETEKTNNKSEEDADSNETEILMEDAEIKNGQNKANTASNPPSSPNTNSDASKEASLSEEVESTKTPIMKFISPSILRLTTNPLHWSVEDVMQFMRDTDCAQLVRLLKDQDIDGQALLLLTLPTVQEHLELQLGPAMKLCHQVERVKLAFYSQFAK